MNKVELHPELPWLNMSRKGTKVDRIVLHTMEGTFKGTRSWFLKERPVSTAAHYLISDDGDILQMVADEKKCWHANAYNSRSIGIEHEGWAKASAFPDALLEASAKVVAALCRKYGLTPDRTHVIGHNEVPGATHTDPGPNWPWDRYMALVAKEHACLT